MTLDRRNATFPLNMDPYDPGTVRVSPSLLAADWSQFGEDAAASVKAGADWLHFDCMDGHFVPNLTFGPQLIRALRPVTTIPFDVHLMVERPYDYLEPCAAAGADLITVHAEASPHLQRTLAAIRALDRKAGFALNPATPLEWLNYVVDDVDLVLIMAVNPGFGGQKFLPATLDKVEDVARLREEEGASFLISVDGGVDDHNAAALVEAGADVLVAGSYLFDHPDGLRGGISSIRSSVTAGP